jgi:hypothetical protein
MRGLVPERQLGSYADLDVARRALINAQETRQAAGEVSCAAKRAAQRSVFLLAST